MLWRVLELLPLLLFMPTALHRKSIGPPFIEREAFEERFVSLWDYRDVRVGENVTRQIDDALSRTRTEGATDGEELV